MLYLNYALAYLNLEFDLKCTGITALCGHSGAGKTTLLRLIAGLESRHKGILKFDSRTWQDHRIFVPPHKRKIGYVFQDIQLFKHLNVSDNLAYAGARSRITVAEIDEICKKLQIDNLMKKMSHSLSGGEKQRVAFARCLCSKPELLLLDEPFTALEENSTNILLDYLVKLKLPTIYVSHSLDEVIKVADYIVQIEHGKILRQGSLNYMLQFLGRNGFVLSAQLLSHIKRVSSYQTLIGTINFPDLNPRTTARLFIDNRNIKIHQHHILSENCFAAIIDAINFEQQYFCRLSLNFSGVGVEVLILCSKLSNVNNLVIGQTIFLEIQYAQVI